MAFIEVSGTVTRTFFQGKGAEVTETFKKRDGSEGKNRFAVWFKGPHGLSEGDQGTWRGTHGVEVDEWVDKEGNTRHTAKVSVNSARAVGNRAQEAERGQEWATESPGESSGVSEAYSGFDGSTPF